MYICTSVYDARLLGIRHPPEFGVKPLTWRSRGVEDGGGECADSPPTPGEINSDSSIFMRNQDISTPPASPPVLLLLPGLKNTISTSGRIMRLETV